jgi:hypothetical protein
MSRIFQRTHSLGGEGDGGSIFWKTRNTALYSTYVSTLWTGFIAFGAGGGHTRWVERGVGGQYFGRRETQLCTLHM